MRTNCESIVLQSIPFAERSRPWTKNLKRIVMKKLRGNPKIIACGSLLLVLCGMARAQENRTFVSAIGDDLNNCRRVTPCKTFTGAITKTNPGGEIDVLDTGGFGATFVNKSVTIDGGGFVAGSLIRGTSAVQVTG